MISRHDIDMVQNMSEEISEKILATIQTCTVNDYEKVTCSEIPTKDFSWVKSVILTLDHSPPQDWILPLASTTAQIFDPTVPGTTGRIGKNNYYFIKITIGIKFYCIKIININFWWISQGERKFRRNFGIRMKIDGQRSGMPWKQKWKIVTSEKLYDCTYRFILIWMKPKRGRRSCPTWG